MKMKTVAFVIGVFLLLTSCASTPEINNPENIPEEDLITLYVNSNLKINRIDDTDVNWSSGRTYIVKLPPGEHALYTKWDNGSWYTPGYRSVRALFEKGNAYVFKYSQSWTEMTLHIYIYNEKEREDGEEVTITSPRTFM